MNRIIAGFVALSFIVLTNAGGNNNNDNRRRRPVEVLGENDDQSLLVNTDLHSHKYEFSRTICSYEEYHYFFQQMEDPNQIYHACDAEQDRLNLPFNDEAIESHGLKKYSQESCAIPECKQAYDLLIEKDLVPNCVMMIAHQPLNLFQLMFAINQMCDYQDDQLMDQINQKYYRQGRQKRKREHHLSEEDPNVRRRFDPAQP